MVYVLAMNDQGDVVGEYEASGVLVCVRWAYQSAVWQTLEDYSTGRGHDAGWLGTTRYTYFRDRMDRVFLADRYTNAGDGAEEVDRLAELPPADIATIPDIESGVVVRNSLHGSPGWAVGHRRLLLASGEYGRLDRIAWRSRSATKQEVAQQSPPKPQQASLFEEAEEAELREMEAAAVAATSLDLDTLVLAHSLDPFSGRAELILGRPKLNTGGGYAWHWHEDLLKTPPPEGGREPLPASAPHNPDGEPDAPVRLRRDAGEQSGQQGSSSA